MIQSTQPIQIDCSINPFQFKACAPLSHRTASRFVAKDFVKCFAKGTTTGEALATARAQLVAAQRVNKQMNNIYIYTCAFIISILDGYNFYILTSCR